MIVKADVIVIENGETGREEMKKKQKKNRKLLDGRKGRWVRKIRSLTYL